MLTASCDCGRVQLEVPSIPNYLNQCGCSLCSRYGVLWAYYTRDTVRVIGEPGATQIYCRGEKTLEFHRCAVCGCITHWVAIDPSIAKMGVNGRLLRARDTAGVLIRASSGPC